MVERAAYDWCLRLARQHYENFPVASWLLPPDSRPHVAAVYAFARTADDFADEGSRQAPERLRLLDDWQARLTDAVAGRTRADGTDASQIFLALGESIRTCGLDVRDLENLLSAFRQDVTTSRYETWDDVIDYCRRSANPVGRLVLAIVGRTSERTMQYSDAVCSALQLTNFWQDLERDWAKGRLYVPLALLRAAGADERDLHGGSLPRAWRMVLADVAARTRELFRIGRPIAKEVGGRLGWELRATWLGGTRILDRLEAADFDVFHRRPVLGWADGPWMGWRMLRWH